MSTVRFDQSSQPRHIRTSSSSNSNGRPKPCLKLLPMPECNPLPFSEYPPHSPHVHFPPTPTLTSTSFTHSAIQYDRAPIVVGENVCALPERGGRSYNTQSRNKRSSSRVSEGHHSNSTSGVGTGGVGAERSVNRALNPSESYFHPRAYEACEPDRRLKDQQAQYNPYFPPSLSLSSSSSSSSSESDSDLELSFSSLSLSSSIPRTVVDSFSLGGASSAYPSDSSIVLHQQNGPQRSRQLSYPSISQQSHQHSQHLSHNVHYSSLPSSGDFRQKKSVTSGGSRKVRGSSSTSTDARVGKFGGGFSDQSMVLDGCLGGF